jgi:hypothetical protein
VSIVYTPKQFLQDIFPSLPRFLDKQEFTPCGKGETLYTKYDGTQLATESGVTCYTQLNPHTTSFVSDEAVNIST